jgi:hypothetical protein
MKNRFLLIALAIISIGVFVTISGRAQDGPPDQPQGPPPQGQQQVSSVVGRLSVVHGQVSTMHGDGTTWGAATVNTPIVLGDKISTSDHSRAEVQLDPANVVRFDQRTEAQVADLQPTKINIQLASGLVDFSVFQGTQADVEVDTPNMGVHPLSPGIYRIQVNSDSETSLIVRQGEAEVLTNQGSTKVEAGQVIQIHGTDNPEYKIDQTSGGDDFDRWCSDRDRQMMNVQTAQQPMQPEQPGQMEQPGQPGPPDQPPYIGSSDLDAYGQWSEVPDGGWCWTPQVDIGWTPYTYGHWGFMPYWGWTWISIEPWGWAPYHYGSWFFGEGRWRWRPDSGFHAGLYGGRGYGGLGVMRFQPRGLMNGRPGGYLPASLARSGFVGSTGRMGFTSSANNWHGYTRSNQSFRGGAGFNSGAGFQGRSAPGGRSYQNGWQRYASPNPYGGGREGYGGQNRNFSGGGYGGGSRPALELNRPIMRQRAPSGGYSNGGYGGGRSYSSPYGGAYGSGRPAPSSGNRAYSAPRSSGGGESHSSGGGGGHVSSGGGGGGHSSGGGGGGHHR